MFIPPTRLPARLSKYKEELVQIGGINYSDAFRPGDLSDSYGISVHRWPYLATRWKRNMVQQASETTSIYAWDGHFIRVTEGSLYYDDRPLTNVVPGPKQYAVVNSKLVIWPDRVYIDIKTGEINRLDAVAYAELATITSDSLSSPLRPLYKQNVCPNSWGGSASEWQPTTYTYGQNPALIKWSKETGWDLPPAELRGMWPYRFGVDKIEVGDIIIPALTPGSERFEWVEGKLDGNPPYDPDVSRYNDEGYYGIVTDFDGYYGVDGSRWKVFFDVYKTSDDARLFSDIFVLHSAVTITGTVAGYADGEKLSIQSFDNATNTIAFPKDSLKIPEYYHEVAERLEPSIYSLEVGGSRGQHYQFKTSEAVESGSYIMLHSLSDTAEKYEVRIWDPAKKEVLATYPAVTTDNRPGPLPAKKYPKADLKLTITRDIPDMDYICSSGNRLWGCSNREHSIYCSELGIPENWFTYDGLSTDSWAVAVGTEGVWTACCKLGNSVLFFKEKSMTKVLGDYPENFVSYDYIMEGVQDGSYLSLQVMDGILYYLGTHGVHGYNGGVAPWLISPNFGDKVFTAGVSGNDGDTYYLSCKEGNKKHLFLYETKEKLWVREDSLYALSFARAGRDLRMLIDDGSVVQVATQQDDTDVDWMATFKPMWETVSGRKTYSKLIIRTELPRGSYIRVSVRHDGGRWDEIGRVVGRTDDAVPIRVPINRRDKLEIKLEGHGPAAVLSVARYFRVGSDR